ncbi:MAG: ATP-dependent helicase [Myxococcales bacterium]|nr:ATP-dependent helicase [Myxococcota bacterium]MDW8283269.1 ATP-dependent helicase [Myxococcales bacterium]
MTEGLLSGLTAAQRRAALHLKGPMLVVAGPGSGKTRTLTARLGYLLSAGHARPEEVVAVTFTRKAAAEVRGRLMALLGSAAEGVRVGTFHAIARALRPPAGPILAEGDRWVLIRRAAERTGVEPRALQRALGRYKSGLAGPELDHGDGALAEAIGAYETLLQSLSVLDLDDLLLGALQGLRHSGRAPFRFVCIDEYQDCSPVQRALARALGGPERNVFAIGDPDQAIYAFRGADSSGILSFCEDFPGAEVVDLCENFRSTSTIVQAAAAVIAGNLRPGRVPAVAVRGPGPPLCRIDAPSEDAEAERIVCEIERLLGGTSLSSHDLGRAAAHDAPAYSFCDIAVLARTGARADALAATLSRAGIPVQRPRRSLLEDDEARDLVAWLRLSADPADRGALLRVLLRDWRAVLPQLEEAGRIALEALEQDVRTAITSRCATLANMPYPERLEAAAALLGTPAEVYAAARALLDRHGPEGLLSDDGTGHESDELDPRAERVAVLTMHGAKGLEFPVVFVAGCEAALLPGQGRTPAEVEEERRLFYVAMTRARDRLYFSWVRRGLGGTAAPSPFLGDVPAALLRLETPPRRKRQPQLKLF